MNTSRLVGGVSLMALLLTACSAPPPQSTPSVSVPPAATSSPAPSPTPSRNENARGQIIKKIGETAGMGNLSGKSTTMTFKVTSIKPVQCDNPYASPPTGTIVAIALEVATTPDFSGPLTVNGQEGLVSFEPYFWKGYAANGTRMNKVDSPAVQGCLTDESQLLPDYIGKGEQANGLVLLDVTSPSGEVAFDPGGVSWVWQYPSE